MNGTPLTLKLDTIEAKDRLREVSADGVARLKLSMRELGQLTPIEVAERTGENSYRLISGAHRLAAAIDLKWPEIQAIVFEGDDDQVRLREIDENLARVELSAFDQANFLEERRQIWERLHGKIVRGGDRRSKVQVTPLVDALKKPQFIAETAAAFGFSKDTIKRGLRRRAHITPTLWNSIRGTEAADNGALLDKLSKLPVEIQTEVLATVLERGCAIGEAVRQATQLPPKDPEIAQYDALVLAWGRAEEAARKRFLTFLASQNKKKRPIKKESR